MSITFYTNPMSRGRTVRWMLEEVGQPYETEILQYGTTMKAPEYLAINPMGKVPALRHGEVVVTETGAILAYLADAFPQAGLAPDLTSRGPYYRWMFFIAGCLEPAWVNTALGVQVPPDRAPMVGYGSFAAVKDVLEGVLSTSSYVLGEKFSAVDVYLGASLGFGMQFGLIEKRPAFEAYLARVSTRPAALRAKAIDDALVPPA